MSDLAPIEVTWLGMTDYAPVWQSMKDTTRDRIQPGNDTTADAIWVTEHRPVYTLGLAGNPAHLLRDNGIALVKTDRGGQITYHGPGQLVVYPLLDLRRYGLRVREYVTVLEQTLIETLARHGIEGAFARADAPGVYLNCSANGQPAQVCKIAALGIKVSGGRTYHGLSLNVDMDLTPFFAINPCGYEGLRTIDMATLGVKISLQEVGHTLTQCLIERLTKLQQQYSEQRNGST